MQRGKGIEPFTSQCWLCQEVSEYGLNHKLKAKEKAQKYETTT